MELFHAGDETQKELIEEWIKESDIYVLLLGGRYGSIDPISGKSYTQWEYEKAGELGKPRFSLVLTEDYINQKVADQKIKATDLEINMKEYGEFKKEVLTRIVSHVNNIDQIESEILKSIHSTIKKHVNILQGWIKGNNLDRITKLEQENKELSSKLLSRQDEVISMKDEYIGEFNFDFVLNEIRSISIKRIYYEVYSSKEIFEKIEKLYSSDATLMDALICFDSFLLRGITSSSDIYRILKGNPLDKLLTFNIIERDEKKYCFSEVGKKFILIYNIKKNAPS